MSLNLCTNSGTIREIARARQAKRVAFLHRAPFVVDALALGFLPGFREDCGYQKTQYQNLNLPCVVWQSRYRNMAIDLEDGMEVVLEGNVDFYVESGKISLKPWR